jgi:hypothetical protein
MQVVSGISRTASCVQYPAESALSSLELMASISLLHARRFGFVSPALLFQQSARRQLSLYHNLDLTIEEGKYRNTHSPTV